MRNDITELYNDIPVISNYSVPGTNENNPHILPSHTHSAVPKIGTTYQNGRYEVMGVYQVNKSKVDNYFNDPYSDIRAFDPTFEDMLVVVDNETIVDGSPEVFTCALGWSESEIRAYNQKFFSDENVLKTFNERFANQVNILRKQHGKQPLTVDNTLHQGSMLRTKESSLSGNVHQAHIRPNGEEFHSVFQYRNPDAEYIMGENQVGIPYNGNVHTIFHPVLMDLAFIEWMDSPTHLENLLYDDYTKVYITAQLSPHAKWMTSDQNLYFMQSIFVTSHFAIK